MVLARGWCCDLHHLPLTGQENICRKIVLDWSLACHTCPFQLMLAHFCYLCLCGTFGIKPDYSTVIFPSGISGTDVHHTRKLVGLRTQVCILCSI